MSAEANIYRNANDEVADHAKRLLANHHALDDSTLGAIYRRRYARLGFGYAGSFAAVLALLIVVLANEGQLFALAMAWFAALLGGAIAYFLAAKRYRVIQKRSIGATSDPYELVIRLTRDEGDEQDGEHLLDHLDRLGAKSHRWPLLVGALLLPISLLALVFGIGGAGGNEIDEILRFAFVYTVHVHLYAAIAAWRYPKKRHNSAMIGVATALGLLPFLISGFVVGVIAVIIVCIYFLPISIWVDRESRWILLERDQSAEAKRSRQAQPTSGPVPVPAAPTLEVELR